MAGGSRPGAGRRALIDLDRRLRELQGELIALRSDVAGPGAEPGRRASAPAPEPAPAPPPEPARAVAAPEPSAPAPVHAPPAAAGGPDFLVDAGPFTDFDALRSFERTLAGVRGVAHAQVRSYARGRAVVALRLTGPLELVEELSRALPRGLDLIELHPGGMRVDVNPPDTRGT